MNGSEIAQFRAHQAAEEESARLALHGFAAQASHDAIIARIEQGAIVLVGLIEEGRIQEMYDLWNDGILERGVE